MRKINLTIMQVLCKMTTAQPIVDRIIEAVSDSQNNKVSLTNLQFINITNNEDRHFSDSSINSDSVKEFIYGFQEAAGIRQKKKWQTIHLIDSRIEIDIHEGIEIGNTTIPDRITFEVTRN